MTALKWLAKDGVDKSKSLEQDAIETAERLMQKRSSS